MEGCHSDFPILWPLVCKDIKSILLTCRRFCSAGPHLFPRSVYVDHGLSSISRLEKISSHPDISRGVRVIRAVLHFYDSTLSDNITDFLFHHADAFDQRIEWLDQGTVCDINKVPENSDLSVVKETKAVLASWHRIASDMPPETLSEEDIVHRTLLEKTPGISEALQ